MREETTEAETCLTKQQRGGGGEMGKEGRKGGREGGAKRGGPEQPLCLLLPRSHSMISVLEAACLHPRAALAPLGRALWAEGSMEGGWGASIRKMLLT